MLKLEVSGGGGGWKKNNSNRLDPTIPGGRENQTLIFDVNNDHKSYGLLRGSSTVRSERADFHGSRKCDRVKWENGIHF